MYKILQFVILYIFYSKNKKKLFFMEFICLFLILKKGYLTWLFLSFFSFFHLFLWCWGLFSTFSAFFLGFIDLSHQCFVQLINKKTSKYIKNPCYIYKKPVYIGFSYKNCIHI